MVRHSAGVETCTEDTQLPGLRRLRLMRHADSACRQQEAAVMARPSDSQAPAQASPASLSQKVTDHTDYSILFRTYVNKKARGKGRAVLEGVGLYTATIDNCFSSNPNNEEVVQDGLSRWCGGKGIQPPTWGVLFDALEYAEIAQQHIQGLKKSLGLLEGSRKEEEPNSVSAQAPPVSLSQKVTDRKDHLMLFRKYVSRKARGKERGVLKGVQLASHAIDECFNDHPLDDEEAVQDGLTRWCEGLGTQPPTWGALIAAMEYAEIEQHSVRGLKERLGLLEGSKEEAMEKRREEEQSQDMIKFQEQYSEVVRNQASVTLKITKCTTIGPPRIGKNWTGVGRGGRDGQHGRHGGSRVGGVLQPGGGRSREAMEAAVCRATRGELIRAVNSSITSNAQLMTTPSDAPSTTTPSDALPTTTPSDAPPTTTPSDAPPTTTPSDAPSTTTPSDAPPTTTPSDAPSTTTIEPCDAPPTIGPSDAPPTTTIGPSDAPPPTTIEPCDAPPTIGPCDAPPLTKIEPCDAPPTTTPSHTEFRTMPTSASPPATMRTPTQNLSTVQQILDDLSGAVSLEKLQDFLKDKQGKILGETRLVHFIDTGGQAIYHDVHPVLITSPSVYLVVFSLKDFYRKKNEERLDYFRNELIQRPLRSIYTFGRKTPTEKDHLQLHPEAPKIFIVGTHLDHVCQADTLSCEEFLQTVHDMIDREISSKSYHQFVQYDTKGRSFWAVDNTLAGREQSEGVKEYISTLRLMVQERTMEMSVKVPLTWMLLRRVMEGKGEQYCKYAELLEQARIRGYVREGSPEKDLDTMLKLFHILGIFYHKVPKGCKKEDSLVFIDPGCLYSTTSDFLMAAKEEMEDSQGASHEDHHQIPTPLEQPNVELTRREDPSYMSQECQEATHQRPVALRSRDSATCQKLTQSAPVQKDLRGGVESVKVFGRISNIVRDFLFDMHTVLGTLERIVIKVYKEPPEVILRNLMRIQQGVEEKCCSDAANTLQSKYRILAQAMVFKLINTVRKVLQSSTSEDKKPQLDSIMRDFWCQCRMTRRSIDVDDLHHLLLLLTELRIIARLNHPDCYVIPASLPQLRGQITPVVGGIEPLLFTVRSQDRRTYFLPSGLFCCLISELVTGLGWTVEPLGRTHVTFTHEDLTGVVHVVEHESYIEIKLEYVQVTEALICKFVRERMHEKISLMYSTIYDPPDESKVAMVASPESRRAVVGFKCNCGRGPTHAPHIAAYVEDEFESCLRCLLPRPMSTELSPLMDEHLVWFS